jgi:hypothetical protein
MALAPVFVLLGQAVLQNQPGALKESFFIPFAEGRTFQLIFLLLALDPGIGLLIHSMGFHPIALPLFLLFILTGMAPNIIAGHALGYNIFKAGLIWAGLIMLIYAPVFLILGHLSKMLTTADLALAVLVMLPLIFIAICYAWVAMMTYARQHQHQRVEGQ